MGLGEGGRGRGAAVNMEIEWREGNGYGCVVLCWWKKKRKPETRS